MREITDAEYEELVKQAREVDKLRAKQKQRHKKRNIIRRIFQPTPEEILEDFSIGL